MTEGLLLMALDCYKTAYMATVYKRGKFWTAQWYRPSGERIAKSTKLTKKREAEAKAFEMEQADRKEMANKGDAYLPILNRAIADAKAGKLTSQKAEEYILEIRRAEDDTYRTLTLAEHLEEWRQARSKRVGDSTAENTRTAIKHFTAVLPPKVMASPVAELTKAHVEAAIHKIKEGKWSKKQEKMVARAASTVNADLLILRQALKDAVENGLCTVNVAKNVKPLPEHDSVDRAPFSPQDVARLLRSKHISPEWQGMILFGAYTGLRLGDISKLESSMIHDGVLVVRPTKTKRKGKDNVLRIPLSKPLIAWLEGRQGPLFPASAKLQSATLSNQFTRAMEHEGLDRIIDVPGGTKASRSFHSLRHSFTTWLAEANIHPDVRQKLTGHASKKAHSVYSHHEKTLVDAITSLPDLNHEQNGKD